MKLLIFVCFLAAGSLFSVGYSYPVHASCKLTWDFTLNCSTVQDKLVAQVKTWSTNPCPPKGQGEKCNYKLVSQTAAEVKTTHSTPVKHYVDDQTFDFTVASNSGCTVQGFSTSETWYAVLDSSTNYCNLHNLVTGSGLASTPGFKEVTSDSQCTQYSSANCDVY